VTVLYRDGYFASEELAPGDLKEKVAATRTQTALTSDAHAAGIGLQAEVVMEPGGGGSQTVRVDLIVDMASVVFAEDGAARVGELHVSVYCGDAKEKVVGEWQGRWTLRGSERLLADWRRDGMDRSVRLTTQETPKYVKVVVYDPGSDRTGSISVKLK